MSAAKATGVRYCACGARGEFEYPAKSSDDAFRSFVLAHYDCDGLAVIDNGEGLAAMRGLRTLARARDWSAGWTAYMGDQSGVGIIRVELDNRAQAEAVLQLIVNAYSIGSNQ